MKKITDIIRNYLKNVSTAGEYGRTVIFCLAAILVLAVCIFYMEKRDSGWEISLTAAMTEEDTYPTAVVEGNSSGSSTSGGGQSANDGADSEEDGEDLDVTGGSANSGGESGEDSEISDEENTGNSEGAGEAAGNSGGADSDDTKNSGETDGEALTGEDALTFDVTIKTAEEISDSVPRITFINEDYEAPADAELPYYIKVNTALNCVTVYGLDENGEYSVPVRAMACSTAKEGKTTPTGTFAISNRAAWMLMVDGTYAQYATRFNGKILFHAVPCNSQNKDDLETEEFNKLGEVASLGCVRLCVADAKWIYENCPEGTGVEVYEDETSPGPMGKPVMITIPEDSEYAGWDPTDPDEENPWNSVRPSIQTSGSLKAAAGTTVTEEMLFDGVTATDTCGNDITEYVGITGIHYISASYDMWQVQYYVVDSLGRETYMYRMIMLE
ncbi:MAG: L,D-transpeptidase family protein [Lachnospiraceae bacterium]|nr:L,D-transpeptidase family protein [Lachnospiraceae bacterium]